MCNINSRFCGCPISSGVACFHKTDRREMDSLIWKQPVKTIVQISNPPKKHTLILVWLIYKQTVTTQQNAPDHFSIPNHIFSLNQHRIPQRIMLVWVNGFLVDMMEICMANGVSYNCKEIRPISGRKRTAQWSQRLWIKTTFLWFDWCYIYMCDSTQIPKCIRDRRTFSIFYLLLFVIICCCKFVRLIKFSFLFWSILNAPLRLIYALVFVLFVKW